MSPSEQKQHPTSLKLRRLLLTWNISKWRAQNWSVRSRISGQSTRYPHFTSHLMPSHSSSQRGGTIRVNASQSFANTLTRALARVNASITSKLDDFFGLSEYDWTPTTRESSPSMYLYELVNWLTTVVDTLVIKETYKDEAYRSAVEYLAECLMARPQLTMSPESHTEIFHRTS